MGELDALRGIAASIVLLFHYTSRSADVLPDAKPIPISLFWGAYGVHLFFAISGFVILMTLERTRNGADFAVSRFARLFPAYWVAIAFTTVSVSLLGAVQLTQPAAITAINFTMLQGFLYLPAVDGVYWSLTVELAFYLCMWSLWRARLLDRIELILLGWIALKLLWWAVPALPSRVGIVLIVDYIPFFAVGMAAYRVHVGARGWLEQVPMLAMGAAAVAVTEPWIALIVYGVIVAVLMAMVAGWLGWLANPVLLWLGALSYPIYLIHQNFGYAVIAALEEAGASPWLALPGAIAATLIGAQLIHELVEQPALRGIRRWWKARSALTLVSSPPADAPVKAVDPANP